jgi:hypothetical protein
MSLPKSGIADWLIKQSRVLIKSWMGHEEGESWEMEMEEKAKDVAEDAASVSDVESVAFWVSG